MVKSVAYVYFYRIPADTLIVHCLTEVLNDPTHFPNPEEFNPERFIETDPASGNMVFKSHPALIYFGTGKRECLGKNLAKMELFLFLSALLHTFNFECVEGKEIPDVDDCHVAITRVPKHFNAKVILR